MQIWTALDDAPLEAGCVEVIPGIAFNDLATPQERRHRGYAFARDDIDAGRVVALPTRAGEALLIHNQLWHRSRVNTTGKRRSALSICYMSAATRCLRKRGTPREFVRLFGAP